MLKLKVNNEKNYEVDYRNHTLLLNGETVNADWQQTGEDKYHLVYKDHSYSVELLGKDESGKQLYISVNGVKHTVDVSDQYDELLKSLGMDKLAASKVNEVKAPMPGLVLRMMATEGQEVKKGDALLVLEAMKMENVIKSATDGTIKKIAVSEKTAVEKNQVLIVFE